MKALSYLTRPRLPRAAFILDAGEAAAIELVRKGNRFGLMAAARVQIGTDLFDPSFEWSNIPNPEGLADAINTLVESAGLGRRQRWSVVLPEQAVKALMLTFESAPSSREELKQMIGWKVQNLVGVESDDLKISHQFIGSGKIPRFLAIAMRKDVLSEYQDLFTMLGWQTGFLVPRFMGEASWFDWDSTPGDKLMVGARGETCQVAIVRNGELLLIRSIDGDPDRFEDEVYRFAMYYRDRIAESHSDARVTSVIANGEIDEQKLSNAIAEALGTTPTLLNPIPDLLDADASTVGPLLVAAAGVATQAWSRS